MTTKLYDPSRSQLIIGARKISGFADGTGIKVTRTVDSLALQVGMDGETCVTRAADKSGSIEITLMSASASNDYLTSLHTLHEQAGSGFFDASLSDLPFGTTICGGADSFVAKPADVERAKEHGTTTWKIVIPKMDMSVGGINPVP